MQSTVGVMEDGSHVPINCDDLAYVRRELLQWIIGNEVARTRTRGCGVGPNAPRPTAVTRSRSCSVQPQDGTYRSVR